MAAVQKPTGPVGPAGTKANQSPTSKAAADKAAAEKKGIEDKKEADKKKAAEKPPADPPLTIWGDSPLKAQKHWSKGIPLQSPVKIMPISGRYSGLKWEIGGPNSWLGLGVEKVSQSYGAEWKPISAAKYAPGVSFEKLSEQKFSLKTSFFDLKEDISHLTEGLKHLCEVSGSETTPPILLYLQGSMQCHVVLTSVKVEYAEALAGDRGYKQAESVDLEFLVVAGPGSGNAYLGGALTSTPQEALAAKKTDKQRLKDGAKAVVDNALGQCLGKKSRAGILDLIEKDKMEDVPSLVALDSEAFVTMAMAGKIPAATLNSNPQLKARFAETLATFMANRENGIARDRGEGSTGSRSVGLAGAARRSLENYYKSSDATKAVALQGIASRELQTEAENGRTAYQRILAAALGGTIDTDENIQEQGSPTNQRLKAFSCAFQLSKANLSTVTGSSDAADPQTVIKMNTFIDKHKAMSGDDIKEYQKAFGLKDEGQVLRLKQVLPAFSRADFEAKVNQKFGSGSGISGAALFSKFIGYTPTP
jgi:hypothetical protein